MHSLVGDLYKHSLWVAFSELNGDLFRTRLNNPIPFFAPGTLLQHCILIPIIRDIVVRDLYAVLYLKLAAFSATMPHFLISSSLNLNSLSTHQSFY